MAGDNGVHCHSLPGVQSSASELVAHDQRWDTKRALAGKAFELGTADARRSHLDHYLAGTGDRFSYLEDLHLQWSRVDHCFHCSSPDPFTEPAEGAPPVEVTTSTRSPQAADAQAASRNS